ncbi:hypothetical protein SAMN05216559_2323 [Halomicrobium zhouii]|uniref:DUF7692 domain-containing protein n=1 Tax=Halomicrobium zhouii TaxID=767519 RepID=A0A1I6L9Q4_9EURY|nr:hypothetical protein [Halomicrobium zhouii]SFS00187.1 hypothetical protein SAMN05216559_2323 [Halomicrobium zhouii]
MRIRTDGKHARREDTIEQAADFWGCNKTTALMQSAEFAVRIDSGIRKVLVREDLTLRQKQEIAQTLSVPSYYEIDVKETVAVD